MALKYKQGIDSNVPGKTRMSCHSIVITQTGDSKLFTNILPEQGTYALTQAHTHTHLEE